MKNDVTLRTVGSNLS